MTVFGKIISGELPAEKIYENEHVIVIKDLYPKAPIHLLIIPKKEFKDIQSVPAKDLPVIGEVVKAAQHVAKELGIENSYRLLTNNGPAAGQTIFHLHFHLLGGRDLGDMG